MPYTSQAEAALVPSFCRTCMGLVAAINFVHTSTKLTNKPRKHCMTLTGLGAEYLSPKLGLSISRDAKAIGTPERAGQSQLLLQGRAAGLFPLRGFDRLTAGVSILC